MGLDFSFKSQFPISQLIQAMQNKAISEDQMRNRQDLVKQQKFEQLLNSLSTAAQIARTSSLNKTDALQRQVLQNQMAGQQEVSSLLDAPETTAQVTSPIQQFTRSKMASPGMSDMPEPSPLYPGKSVSPQFGQTAQYSPETGQVSPNTPEAMQSRLLASLAKSNPDVFAKQALEKQFSERTPPSPDRYKPVSYTGEDGGSYVALIDTGTGEIVKTGLGGTKQNVRTPKITTLPDGSKAEVILDADGNIATLRPLTGPKMPTPDQAGRLAMTEQAIKDINEYESNIIGKDGKVNRKLLFEANTPFGGLPFTQGRTVNSLIENAVQAKLRIETGAAATTDEVKRIAQRFRPSVGDNDSTVKNKFKRLREYMQGTINVADPTGQYRKGMGFEKPESDPLKLF